MDIFFSRMVHNIFGRANGPMAMRLAIQPLMAAIFAAIDGIRDARHDQPPYLWSLVKEPEYRGHRIKHGWKSIRKTFFLALLVDIAYQITELGWVYIGEALIMAEGLALVPYVLLRGPFSRVARACGWHKEAARRM